MGISIFDSVKKISDNLKLPPILTTTYKPSAHAVASMVASSQPYVLHHSSIISQLTRIVKLFFFKPLLKVVFLVHKTAIILKRGLRILYSLLLHNL